MGKRLYGAIEQEEDCYDFGNEFSSKRRNSGQFLNQIEAHPFTSNNFSFNNEIEDMNLDNLNNDFLNSGVQDGCCSPLFRPAHMI